MCDQMFLSDSILCKMALNQLRMILEPPTLKTNKNTAIIHDLVHADCQLIVRETIDKLNLNFYMVHPILTEDLNMCRISAKFIPKLLAEE